MRFPASLSRRLRHVPSRPARHSATIAPLLSLSELWLVGESGEGQGRGPGLCRHRQAQPITVDNIEGPAVEIADLKSFSIYELSLKAVNPVGRSASIKLIQITGPLLLLLLCPVAPRLGRVGRAGDVAAGPESGGAPERPHLPHLGTALQAPARNPRSQPEHFPH